MCVSSWRRGEGKGVPSLRALTCSLHRPDLCRHPLHLLKPLAHLILVTRLRTPTLHQLPGDQRFQQTCVSGIDVPPDSARNRNPLARATAVAIVHGDQEIRKRLCRLWHVPPPSTGTGWSDRPPRSLRSRASGLEWLRRSDGNSLFVKEKRRSALHGEGVPEE